MIYTMILALSVLTIAHRGASGEAPENTLAAFQRALALGADWIELDIHYAADNSMVVIHDATVNRTTSGSGAVSEMTAEDISKLDAGSWFAPRFGAEKVPMLEDVLETVALPASAGVLIEIKKGNGLPADFADRLLAAIRRYNLQDRVIVQSFDHDAVRRVKSLAPVLTTAALIGESVADPVGDTLAARSEILAIRYTLLTPQIVRQAKASGLKVFVWTVNSSADIQRMIEMGVDGIISDYPDRVLAASARRDER